MTDDEIVKRITEQCVIAVILNIIGRKEKAQLFAAHALRLVYTHHVACARWMESHNHDKRLIPSGI